MVPLLICSYRPLYLRVVLGWLQNHHVAERYRVFAWDNGGADALFREAGLTWQCVRDAAGIGVVNVGKALAMQHLVDAVNNAMPEADCCVCMDDDIIVDRDHLDALVAMARRPGMGMIGPRVHPFNSAVPAGGNVSRIDGEASLRTYPAEDRTVRKLGRVAGGLFAISKAAMAKLPWAPHLYPILASAEQKPVVYWTEDASLEFALTAAGLTNGNLESPALTPVIHLPELNPAYVQWKLQARTAPLTTPEFFSDEPPSRI